jgi:peptide/nickel transport system substrate-binding protein
MERSNMPPHDPLKSPETSSSFTRPNRRQVLRSVTAGISAAALAGEARVQPQSPVRVATSLTDIPRLWAGPEGSLQNLGYSGYLLFDALINWDVEREDRASELVPGLAESWSVDPNDSSRWIFKLRSGVTFHDGTPFNADVAKWNFESVFDEKAPHYNATRVALIRGRLFGIAGADKIDDRTIAVHTRGPDATIPFQVSFLLMASSAQYAKVGNDWQKFAAEPAGTGPFRFRNLVPRTRLELVRNEKYWDAKRVPKSSAVTVVPIPDANARIAALRSGQVDLMETVPPDAIPSLKAAGFTVRANTYPTVLVWSLSMLPDSPFRDVRVRRAVNLGINREGVAKLLNGLAVAAEGFVARDSPWFGNAGFTLRYAPDEARKLLTEAGYGPNNRPKAKILITAAGGGMMEPLKVNELIQSDLAAIGFDIEFQVVDYTTLLTIYRLGAKAPQSAGIHAVGLPAPTHDPTSTFVRGFHSDLVAPRGFNWGYYANKELDDALAVVARSFDPAALDQAIAQVNRLLVDDVPYLLIVHERNSWAMSSRVKNFVLAQNRFVNLTSVAVE